MHDTNPSKPVRRGWFGWHTILPILAVGLAIGAYALSQWETTIEVDEETAQKLLDVQVEKYLGENPDVTIERAELTFNDDSLTLDVAGGKTIQNEKFGPQTASVALTTTGDPDYRGRSIYYNAETFNFDEMTLNGEDPLDVAKRVLAAAALEAPVVRDRLIENDRVQGGLDFLREKAGVIIDVDEAANDAAIQVAEELATEFVEAYRVPTEEFLEGMVVRILEDTPLYTLGKDWKEMLAAAALADIGIIDGKMTATLSGLQIVTTIAVWFLIISLSLGYLYAGLRDRSGHVAALGSIFAAWS